jgi:outer membrane immunogenic protein
MRRFTVVVVGLFLFSGFPSAASAADLPAQTYPAAPAAGPLVTYNWTGRHVGGHVGGVLGISRNFSAVGFVGGGQFGRDYEFAPGWVAGVEGRAAWSSLKNSHASRIINRNTGITIPSQLTLSNDLLVSATARLGYSFADRWLVFVRGGAAWTQEKMDDALTTPGGIAVDPSATNTRTGWTAGTGVEYAFSQNWSVRLEYNYLDFGSHGTRVTSATNNTFVNVTSLDDKIHELVIGLNYHF